MTVGERMKEIRKRLGMSQVAFADKINVSKQTLYKYENNIVTNIPSDKIEAAAELGNVSPAYLMGWEMDDGDIGNALVADCLEKEIDNMASLAPSEKDHFKAYINLLEINRKKVDDYTNQLLSIQQMEHDAVLWSHDNCMTFNSVCYCFCIYLLGILYNIFIYFCALFILIFIPIRYII